jgi:DNA ligase-1
MPGILRATAHVVFTVLLCLSSPSTAADAPSLMLATKWDATADPAGWWMSEKYDGIRGYWDGARMWTRQGEPIAVPEALRVALPDFPLDGELWMGRGRFEATASVVRDAAPGPEWEAVRYMVFDAPGVAAPFEARVAAVDAWLREHPSARVVSVAQVRCRGRAHLEAFLRDTERQGGEGVMLRGPASAYVAGRSDQLRKHKSFEDAEATVRGYNPGRGKYAGMVGSLRMELPDGARFSLGSGLSDAERRAPPPIGSIVTFRYQGWTAQGKPRFPVYWRIRERASAPDQGISPDL